MNTRKMVVLLVLAVAACHSKQDAPSVVATVNGQPVHQSLLAVYARVRVGRTLEQLSAPDRATLLNGLVQLEAAGQAAAAEGLDKNPDTAAELALARDQVLLQRLLSQHVGTREVTDANLRQEYDAQLAASPALDYHVRHILLTTAAAGDDVIRELKAGTDFAALAGTRSVDSTKTRGGDLGWVNLGHLPKTLAQAIQTLQVGEYSATPIQTEYGWHVVQVVETRTAVRPDFEQVREQLRVTLRDRAERSYLERLVGAAKIERTPAADTRSAPSSAARSAARIGGRGGGGEL